MAQPDLDIATYLGATLATLTLGTNLFAGPIRTFSTSEDSAGGVPPSAVFCLMSGGKPDEVFHEGSASTLRHLAYPSVQIFIRYADSFQAGQVLAESIFSAVNHRPTTDYVEWSVSTSSPLYLGQEDDQHHEWSINVSIILDEVVP